MRAVLGHALLLSFALACSEGSGGAPSGSAASGATTGGTSGSTGSGGQSSGGGGQGGSSGASGGSSAGSSGAASAGGAGGQGGGGASGGGGSGGSAGTQSAACDPSVTAQSRETAANAFDGLFVNKQVSAIEQYWADPYLQHNPIAESGVDAFESIMSSYVTQGSFSYERLRTLADCDLAVVQGEYSGTGVIFDMVRVSDGKLVEHWDSDSGQASDASGTTEVTDAASTEQNRAEVLAFIQEVLIDGNHASASTLLAASYVEHREASASGPPAFVEYVTGDVISYSEVHHVIADGNFVFTISEGELDGVPYGFYDLFRLEAGQIVEHWDSRRIVPTNPTASGLPIF